MKTQATTPQTETLTKFANELSLLGIQTETEESLRRHYNGLKQEKEASDERIGELNLALAAQKEQLAHLERTKTLSLNLIKAMEAVHASEDFKGVWTLAQVHGVEYKGPTYKKEFAELKKEVFA